MQERYTEGQVVAYILAKAEVRKIDEKRASTPERPKNPKLAPKKKFKEMTGEEAMMWANQAGGGKF